MRPPAPFSANGWAVPAAGGQDSGGIWPGLKVIQGALAQEGDPEYGVSKGCLLPRHRILDADDLHPEIHERLAESLVLIHGGMAQNVGPILEMVTEKYLLRCQPEWDARRSMRGIFDGILGALKAGDVQALGRCTTANWDGPLKTIIPWATNRFTETITAGCRARFGENFWGFLMLGGMSGGGMGLLAAPEQRDALRDAALEIMARAKQELEDALPFAMNPVVYDFRINPTGTQSRLLTGGSPCMPARYYALQVPQLVRQDPETIPMLRRIELDRYTMQCHEFGQTFPILRTLVSNLFRVASSGQSERARWDRESERIRRENGFDLIQHEQIREDLRHNRIGLAHNRLPVDTDIQDVRPGDVTVLGSAPDAGKRGAAALREGRVAVMSLAGGVGSRWTTGAGGDQGRQPLHPNGRKTPQLPRTAPRQDPQFLHPVGSGHPPHRVHQFPHPWPHRKASAPER